MYVVCFFIGLDDEGTTRSFLYPSRATASACVSRLVAGRRSFGRSFSNPTLGGDTAALGFSSHRLATCLEGLRDMCCRMAGSSAEARQHCLDWMAVRKLHLRAPPPGRWPRGQNLWRAPPLAPTFCFVCDGTGARSSRAGYERSCALVFAAAMACGIKARTHAT